VELDAPTFHEIGMLLGPLRLVPGGMQAVPGIPHVQRLTNLDADGAPTGINPDPYSLHWHSDGSATRIPARYTLLYAVRVPSHGGETSFVDMYGACAALPPARRQALIGKRAIHDSVLARHFRHANPIVPKGTSLRRSISTRARFVGRMLSWRAVRQPVLREHEETGRTCLYLGDHAWRMTGLRWRAGARLVDELNAFATSLPQHAYMHSWQAGDLIIWDNRCLLHRGSAYDHAGQHRVMLRSVVRGTSPVLAARA
jgi:alpha-ketoglutarate-dependent taurine dioxygenase